MAITVSSTPTYLELKIRYVDWRGQTFTKYCLLAGTTTTAQVADILTQIDALTNCEMISAELLSITAAAGMKGAALSNVPNDDINDIFELTFLATDTTTIPNKVITKSVFVPAPLRAMENADGTLNTTGTVATQIDTLLTDLAAHLIYKEVTGVYAGSMTYANSESHHISLADVVDNK